ncbi:hypothetical protein DAPK24_031120 [Pichia kluyveri]|uniref:Uncharacterized protein n=1 Tax=Pichia kluyveri TaxID=36015 RepID=A0AAV5R6A8_PICKL|nr:hypothetical protein DAPK24_031120 [Pichia kluyveri]
MLEIMNLKDMFPIAVKLTSDEKNSREEEIGELSELGLMIEDLEGAPISHKTYIFNQASRMGVFHEMSDQLKKVDNNTSSINLFIGIHLIQQIIVKGVYVMTVNDVYVGSKSDKLGGTIKSSYDAEL